MSGGFFRGTSADQDTRFSNKQAKLMKSQKFAPELETLVDITKVKMDVMRPWIAHRVTELLGFEDEVLINFIYGLLEGKVVNGKEIQISLTGFMEKNTGKFMKELWTLLLSAQKNASGVPQQFLDAKEEETRKKKAETDRITNEIQRKKEEEGRERDIERMKLRDGEVDISRANNAALERSSRHQPRASSTRSADEKEIDDRNGASGRNRVSISPHSAENSPSSPRRALSRSISRSFSNSRSRSDERRRPKSISGSPEPRGRSFTPQKVNASPIRRSPRWRDSPRRSISPRRRPSYYRRRSPSFVRRGLHSPIRRRSRSPLRRRSRSPMRRKSRSPVRRRSRSPIRLKSRSPMRRRSSRSPVRRRSRSPLWRRSRTPMRPRSPSPGRRRSPSPMRRRYRRSPSSPRHRSPSPIRRRPPIPGRRRSPSPSRRRSPSPQEWSSQSPVRHTSPSPVRRRRSPLQSPRDRIRALERHSPGRRAAPRVNLERLTEARKESNFLDNRPPVSARSPQRDPGDQTDSRRRLPAALLPSPKPSDSESPPAAKRRSSNEDRRSSSPYEIPVKLTRKKMIHGGSPSPPRKARELKPIHESPEASGEEKINHARVDEDRKLKSSGKRYTHSSTADERKRSAEKVHNKDEFSPERLSSRYSREVRSRPDNIELRKMEQETRSETISEKVLYPEVPERVSPATCKGPLSSERIRESYSGKGYKADETSISHPNGVKGSARRLESETLSKLSSKIAKNDQIGSMDSGSEETDRHEKRKHKKSKRQEVESDDDYSSDSQLEERKGAKRRKKEEKRLKKEERRRRREDRRRRKEERRTEKLKLKADVETKHDGYTSCGEHAGDAKSDQKKLEIALREKALESLRAKKGVSN